MKGVLIGGGEAGERGIARNDVGIVSGCRSGQSKGQQPKKDRGNDAMAAHLHKLDSRAWQSNKEGTYSLSLADQQSRRDEDEELREGSTIHTNHHPMAGNGQQRSLKLAGRAPFPPTDAAPTQSKAESGECSAFGSSPSKKGQRVSHLSLNLAS